MAAAARAPQRSVGIQYKERRRGTGRGRGLPVFLGRQRGRKETNRSNGKSRCALYEKCDDEPGKKNTIITGWLSSHWTAIES